jgi:adenine-specific DNA-methyltransferase
VRGSASRPGAPAKPTRARELRRALTDAERRLWSRLRDRRLAGAKFRRQQPIGPFIADFCCPERSLVVELDGGQHQGQVGADARRTAFLESRGFRVLRFWDNEALQETEAVLARILEALDAPLRPSPPSPRPSPSRGGRGSGRTAREGSEGAAGPLSRLQRGEGKERS